MGPRYNPYSRKSTPIQWGVSNGPHVRHDTRLPHDFRRPGPRVRETTPEHALAPPAGAGHASGQGTLGTSSGSSGSSSCLWPTFVGVPSSTESDLSRSRRTGAPQLLAYTRGHRDVALQIAADPGRRELPGNVFSGTERSHANARRHSEYLPLHEQDGPTRFRGHAFSQLRMRISSRCPVSATYLSMSSLRCERTPGPPAELR